MQLLEVDFLEEYKCVDAICGDMYSCRAGVTEYITQMEQIPASQRAVVSSWEYNYRKLRHLRDLRNRIVHDQGASACTDADLDDLMDFHDRLLCQQDPLSALARAKQAMRQTQKTTSRPKSAPPPTTADSPPETEDFFGKLLPIAALFFILLFHSSFSSASRQIMFSPRPGRSGAFYRKIHSAV